MTEPAWCEEARSLYEQGLSTFKVASRLQRPSCSIWKALHPECKHTWLASERVEVTVLPPNRRLR